MSSVVSVALKLFGERSIMCYKGNEKLSIFISAHKEYSLKAWVTDSQANKINNIGIVHDYLARSFLGGQYIKAAFINLSDDLKESSD
jgi:hypothetical protein